MARHPEVKETDIIAAGEAIERAGKLPNPGSIRAKLGFKGGLVRIRNVWEKHISKRTGQFGDKGEHQLSLDDLPSELAEAAYQTIIQQKESFEKIVTHAYQRCQNLFEKRLDEQIFKHETSLKFYEDYESSADESISKLEAELKDLQSELETLAKQNAKLLIENSKLNGQVLAFERSLPNIKSLA